MNTREFGVSKLAVMLKEKVDVIDYLIELAGKYEWFSWTGLATGSFFEWVCLFFVSSLCVAGFHVYEDNLSSCVL